MTDLTDCIFCAIVRGDAPSWRVYETDTAYGFLDINPVTPYHTLVIPKRHATDLFEVPARDLCGVMEATKHTADRYRERLGITDIQVVTNSGPVAQQIVFHLHVHIVPRYEGDGQDIQWTTHPEMRPQFDGMLERLRQQT